MKRVWKGAGLLDDVMPGWARKLGPIDLNCPIKCVIGQLFGEYSNGVCILFSEPDLFASRCGMAEDHGFNAPGDITPAEREYEVKELEVQWQIQVRGRI